MNSACDLERKESLVRVFSVALGFLPPNTWKKRFEEIISIFQNRGFACEPTDTIQIIADALYRVPKEKRTESVAAIRGILGETDFTAALEHLLSIVPRRSDHPWHRIIRKEFGELVYREMTAGLEMATQDQVAEVQDSYSGAKGKMSQRGLFE